MMIKTPKFWYRSSFFGTFISLILLPLSLCFVIFSYIRNATRKTYHLNDKTVICIGNIIAGGAGKTPIAISLCNELKSIYSVCFLSRGYGRNGFGFLKVDHSMDATITGDEPQLLQRHGQVYLYTTVHDILDNISQISEDIIIMDDGLQNNSIYKDCNILVLDGRMFGNGKIIPAGPLRESISSVLKKVHYTILTGDNSIPIASNAYHVRKSTSSSLKPQKVVAFSGIGDNSKFINSLTNEGYEIINFFDFPDHHPYSESDIEKIQAFAHEHNLQIITTEKDYVKLSYHAKHNVHVLKLEIHLDKNLVNEIKDFIKSFRG